MVSLLSVLETQNKMNISASSSNSKMSKITASQRYILKREQTFKVQQMKAIEIQYVEGETVNPRDIHVQTGIEDLKNGSRHQKLNFQSLPVNRKSLFKFKRRLKQVPELTKRLNQQIQQQAGNLAYYKLLNVRIPPIISPSINSNQERASPPLQGKPNSPTKLQLIMGTKE